MERITDRPLVFFGVAFLPFVALFFFASSVLRSIAALICISMVIFCAVLRPGKVRRFLRCFRPLLLGIGCAGIVSQIWFSCAFLPWQSLYGETLTLSGVVSQIDYSSDYAFSLGVRVRNTSEQWCFSELTVSGTFSTTVQVGDRVTVCGVLSAPFQEESQTERLRALANGRAGLLMLGGPESLQNSGSTSFSPLAFFDRIRRDTAARFDAYYSPDLAGLCKDFLLGIKDGVNPAIQRDCKRLGLSHVLAVSGLHFSIFIALFEGCMCRLRLHKKVRCIVIMVFSTFFICLSGGSASVLRAGIMIFLLQLSYLCRAESDSLTSLFFAGILIVLFSPGSILDPGFLLSFLATLGILTVGQQIADGLHARFHKWPHFLHSILRTVCITVSALLFTTPVVLLYFRQVSVLSIFSNLIFEPILVLFIPIGLCLLLLSYLPGAAAVFDFSLSAVLSALLYCMRVCARLPFAVVSFRTFWAALISAVMYVAGIFWYFKSGKKRILFGTFAACFVLLFVVNGIYGFLHRGDVSISYRNTGKNDTVCFVSGNEGILLDCSNGNYATLYSAASDLSEYGITEIKTIVYTHLHARSVKTFKSISQRYVIREIVLPSAQTPQQASLLEAFAAAAAQQNTQVEYYDPNAAKEYVCGESFSLELFPQAFLARSVEPLCTVSVTAAGRRILFMSAAYAQGAALYRSLVEESALLSDAVVLFAHGPDVVQCTLPATDAVFYIPDTIQVSQNKEVCIRTCDWLEIEIGG